MICKSCKKEEFGGVSSIYCFECYKTQYEDIITTDNTIALIYKGEIIVKVGAIDEIISDMSSKGGHWAPDIIIKLKKLKGG